MYSIYSNTLVSAPTQQICHLIKHPLHWIIALGITETKMSFYRMDAGIDTGNILIRDPCMNLLFEKHTIKIEKAPHVTTEMEQKNCKKLNRAELLVLRETR